MTGRWFCPGTPVSSTNKTELHDIAKILLKASLNTISRNPFNQWTKYFALFCGSFWGVLFILPLDESRQKSER
jgi:hypothetical protein